MLLFVSLSASLFSCALPSPLTSPLLTSHATNFSISRRRSVVPLHKRLESHLARIQILTTGPSPSTPRHDALAPNVSLPSTHSNATANPSSTAHHQGAQLVSFLEDFPLGRCMNFALRETDACESFSRSGKHFVRFVDAKFALPGATTGSNGVRDGEAGDGSSANGGRHAAAAGNEFVCLDMLEYATEHDDIFVGFDSEEGL